MLYHTTCALANTSRRSCTMAMEAADTSTDTGTGTGTAAVAATGTGIRTLRRNRAVDGSNTLD